MWLKKLLGLSSPDSPKGLKEIVYRGGLVTFSIPSNWVEEYDEEGGAVFYEPVPDSGTLRLNVLSFTDNEESEKIDVDTEVKQKAKEFNGSYKILDEGNALVWYDQASTEDNHKVTLRYWNIYNPVPPNLLRIVIFSYTLLESQIELPKFREQLEMLDKQITDVKFATQTGILS